MAKLKQLISNSYWQVWICLLAAGNVAAFGEAAKSPKQHHWQYGFVTEYQCIQTPPELPPAGGFTADPPYQLLTQGELIKVSGYGVMTFKSDGTVHVSEVVGSQLNIDRKFPGDIPLAPGISGECNDGHYEILEDNRIKVVFPTCGVELPGFSAIGGPLELEGLYARNLRWIKLALVNGSIQTMALSIDGLPEQQIQRACLQTFVLDKK